MPRYCYTSTVPKHSVKFSAWLSSSTKNGNQRQKIASHLVKDQSNSVIIGAGPNHSIIFGDHVQDKCPEEWDK